MRQNGHEIPIRHLHLSQDEINMIGQRLSEFLFLEKPFLKHGYTLGQLSDDIGISLHRLSAFINQHYDMNFNDLINRYRIDYCVTTFGKKDWMDKKIATIAQESGFNNRNTFSAAFKKVTGISPSKYFANNYKS